MNEIYWMTVIGKLSTVLTGVWIVALIIAVTRKSLKTECRKK